MPSLAPAELAVVAVVWKVRAQAWHVAEVFESSVRVMLLPFSEYSEVVMT
jgi:hypothetical protein